MHFGADVRWGSEGTLEGDVAVEGWPPMTFHGVIELVGLLETLLGPPPQPTADGTGADDYL